MIDDWLVVYRLIGTYILDWSCISGRVGTYVECLCSGHDGGL
jgi:hypothetical protein